jgi:hypothetical protein
MSSPYVPDGLAPIHNSTFTRHLLHARENITPNQFRESRLQSSAEDRRDKYDYRRMCHVYSDPHRMESSYITRHNRWSQGEIHW